MIADQDPDDLPPVYLPFATQEQLITELINRETERVCVVTFDKKGIPEIWTSPIMRPSLVARFCAKFLAGYFDVP